MAGRAKPIRPNLSIEDGKVTASYTLTRNNAIGPARFSVVCGIDIDHARVGVASFRVLASNGQSSGGNGHSANRNDSQFPSRSTPASAAPRTAPARTASTPCWCCRRPACC